MKIAKRGVNKLMRTILQGITPNTLPTQYHTNFCICNPFYTTPQCLWNFKKTKSKTFYRYVSKSKERSK
ncbi:MAG: hypothetical protein AABY22_05670 [Nanoarchaeota archaeon]